MKKYSIFELYVVEMNGKKFICKYYDENKYMDIFTDKIISNTDYVERLSDYYPNDSRINLETGIPLKVSREILLLKYIEINTKKNTAVEERIDKNKTDLVLEKLIGQVLQNPDEFYRQIGMALSSEERIYILDLIKNKSCYTCTNACCRVEQVDKPIDDCLGWMNEKIIGKYRVLTLGRNNGN